MGVRMSAFIILIAGLITNLINVTMFSVAGDTNIEKGKANMGSIFSGISIGATVLAIILLSLCPHNGELRVGVIAMAIIGVLCSLISCIYYPLVFSTTTGRDQPTTITFGLVINITMVLLTLFLIVLASIPEICRPIEGAKIATAKTDKSSPPSKPATGSGGSSFTFNL